VKQQTSAAEYTEHNAKLYDAGGCEVLLADGQNAVLSCHITYQLPATSALMPPKQWKIHAHKIEGVAEHTGFWDNTDPYVKVMVVKNEYKTKVCPTTGRAEVKSGGGKVCVRTFRASFVASLNNLSLPIFKGDLPPFLLFKTQEYRCIQGQLLLAAYI
jgi:hypothetical protein